MLDRRSCKVVFVRHGETEYTDKFPDITSEGERCLRQTAKHIDVFAKGLRIKFYSSPKVRTLGSAACLVESLGLDHVDTTMAPNISACEQRQPEAVMRLIERHLSPTNPLAVEGAYWIEDAFDDSEIMEPRGEIRERSYIFLDRLIKVGLLNEVPSCYVCVSHAEVLGHFVQDVQALVGADINPVVSHAEPIFLTITQEDIGCPVLIDFKFGGLEVEALDFEQIKSTFSCC